jgi:predicted HAD superfamily Cof-like phosphohydrolase
VFDPIDPHMNALAIKMPGHPESQAKVNDVEVFDALIDLNYVSLGTAHLLGYPWPGGWKEVQEANMAKRRASSASESGRGSALDVIKPEGWTPPDLGRVLKDYDFDIEDDA